MTLAASILFDAAYVEAALVTAYELRNQRDVLHRVHLVLLTAAEPDADDIEAAAIVQQFCAQFNDEQAFYSGITIPNSIPAFQVDHFSNSIVYKALLPTMLGFEPYLVNIDAGILPGERMGDFLREVEQRFCAPGTDQGWIIGAHCVENKDLMPAKLAGLPANPLYPAGNVLLFNTAQYLASYFSQRLLHFYGQLVEHLEYAEQELICLTATGGELVALPRADERITPFLNMDVLAGMAPPLPANSTEDCVFFKFVGGLKPWKYWVLDPNKVLFTRRRAALEAHFGLRGWELVRRHRHAVQHHEHYRVLFLEFYERYMSAQGTTH